MALVYCMFIRRMGTIDHSSPDHPILLLPNDRVRTAVLLCIYCHQLCPTGGGVPGRLLQYSPTFRHVGCRATCVGVPLRMVRAGQGGPGRGGERGGLCADSDVFHRPTPVRDRTKVSYPRQWVPSTQCFVLERHDTTMTSFRWFPFPCT